MTAGDGPLPSPEQADPAAEAAASAPLTGARVRGLFAAASSWLERNAAAINAINVFPVPDGDTGSNMSATLKDTLAGLGTDMHTVGEVTAAVARRALMAARGNSGVILSQLLRGFAEATSGIERLDGAALSRALTQASKAAYAALEHPVEGTILTVAGAAAEAASRVKSSDPGAVLEAALTGARTALARTPEYLPALKRAGVVDSGGFGLVVILEGAVRFLRGESEPEAPHEPNGPLEEWTTGTLAAHGSSSHYGYCTEFIVSGDRLDIAGIRGRIAELGDSLIVVGDANAVRVHVHTDDPGAALSHGTSLGPLSGVKVENMQAQFERFAGRANVPGEPATAEMGGGSQQESIARLAVVSGDGLAAIALSLGASSIIPGGQTMNPSVEQILRAIEAAGANDVIVLPNNKNVVLTAEQAARMTPKSVAVLRTISVPQGISALLSFNDALPLAENLAAMQSAADLVRTVEITRAARDVKSDEFEIHAGEPIALIDDVLALSAATPEDALLEATAQLSPGEGAVMTLYFGRDVPQDRAELTERMLRTRFPCAEIEMRSGGQPFYDYVLSLE